MVKGVLDYSFLRFRHLEARQLILRKELKNGHGATRTYI